MTDWITMHSAPKDGTLILLSKGTQVLPGFYSSFHRGKPVWCVVDPSDDTYPEEWSDHWDLETPTRWMPLPTPHKEGANQ